MKKRIIVCIGLLIVALGIGGGVYLAERGQFTESNPLEGQRIVITSVETDIEDLEIEVSVQQAEQEEEPVIEVFFRNNLTEDIGIYDHFVYYKETQEWSLRDMKSETGITLELPVVLCAESVDRMSQMAEGDFTNTRTRKYSPWKIYSGMEQPGEYLLEIEIISAEDREKKLGKISIEWTQEENNE